MRVATHGAANTAVGDTKIPSANPTTVNRVNAATTTAQTQAGSTSAKEAAAKAAAANAAAARPGASGTDLPTHTVVAASKKADATSNATGPQPRTRPVAAINHGRCTRRSDQSPANA